MFASVKFREGDSRTYTYACDLPVKPGDRVTVDTKDGQKVVVVAEVDLPEPAFACKPITGIAPPKAGMQSEDGSDGGDQ
jgi:formylmethanofuran dehydrogenase subunit D